MTHDRVSAIAKRPDLDLGRKYREYSHGNKQKLALLIAFAPEPDLLIVDEPTTGLDPLHQQVFYALVKEAKARGATILISSHVLSEVEQVCDRVGIVREGHLATLSPIGEPLGMKAHNVPIALAGPPPADRPPPVPGFAPHTLEGARGRGESPSGITPGG